MTDTETAPLPEKPPPRPFPPQQRPVPYENGKPQAIPRRSKQNPDADWRLAESLFLRDTPEVSICNLAHVSLSALRKHADRYGWHPRRRQAKAMLSYLLETTGKIECRLEAAPDRTVEPHSRPVGELTEDAKRQLLACVRTLLSESGTDTKVMLVVSKVLANLDNRAPLRDATTPQTHADAPVSVANVRERAQ